MVSCKAVRNTADNGKHPQYRHHRSRRPWQDHTGRPPAADRRHLPRKPAGRGARPGLQRSGARAWHHHSLQERIHPLQGREDQRHRYAGSRRLWRRGRACAQDGRWRLATSRCLRGPHAADAFRSQACSQPRLGSHRRHQQDRPPRRAPRRGSRRGLRAHARARCKRRAARLHHHLCECHERLRAARAR